MVFNPTTTSSAITPTLKNDAMPQAQGLRLTAIRSGTGIGVEVSSSGGIFEPKEYRRL